MRQRDASSARGRVSSTRADDLAAFLEASRAAAGQDLRRSLSSILDVAIRLLGADEGSVMMLDEQAGGLRIIAGRGVRADVQRDTLAPLGSGIAGTVAKNGIPLLLPSPLDVSRFAGYVAKTRPITSAICVPLTARGRTLGVLNVNLVRPGQPFDNEDLTAAVLFAEHAAIAISSSELLGRSEQTASDLELLRAARARLSRSLKLDTVADAALTEALALCGASAGLLVLAGDGRVELARYRGLSRASVRAVLAEAAFASFLASAQSASGGSASGQSAIVRAVATDPLFRGLAAEAGPHPIVVAALPSCEGSPGGMLAVVAPGANDRTERLLAAYAGEAGLTIANAVLHEQVRIKEEELATIVDAMTRPIVLIDQDGLFRAINPAAAETFRLAPEFEIGQSARGRLGDVLEELLIGGAEGMREVILPVGGEPHVWQATVTTTQSGPVAGGRLLILDDVTVARELEQRKADFLAVIGHELRTPLTVICGYASTLSRRDGDMEPETRDAAVATILGQAARLGQMIEDLLYVSRIENRTPPLHLAWEDLVAALRETVASVAEGRGRTITLRGGLNSPHLLFDRIKIEQVLRHLLDNALKYSDAESSVEVSVSDEQNAPGQPDQVRITVSDRGIGIFSGDIPRLFRVFGQLDGSSTRRHGGTGVGLSVSKMLVESMGGRIWAESMLGKGSDFSFTIPKTPPESERAL